MKRALVTGASRGIGRAIVEMLLDDGWDVVGISRTMPPIADRAFEWVGADFSDGECRLEAVLRGFDGESFDALIHCVGAQEPVGSVEDTDPDAWERAIRTNLIGTYRVVKAALPALRRSEDARILVFSGGGAFSPRPNFSAYAASKGGVVALIEALAGELPPNVTANCIAPGFVPTGIHAATLAAGPDVVGTREHRHATRDGEGAMETVLACVQHLLSDHTRGLTGKTVSAPYDHWHEIRAWNVDAVNRSPAGTRDRHKIPSLAPLSKSPNAVLV